jgi:phage shock protein PspC (stress-responsive transcriptional regulator)
MKKLYKSTKDNVLTGILGGIADLFKIDSNIVRLCFLVVLVVTGFFPLLIIYVLGYFFIPTKLENNKIESQLSNKNSFVLFVVFLLFLVSILFVFRSKEYSIDSSNNIKQEFEVSENKIVSLSYEIIETKISESLYVDGNMFEALVIVPEISDDVLVRVGKQLKDDFEAEYRSFKNVQVYIFEDKYVGSVRNFLELSDAESDSLDKLMKGLLVLKERGNIFFIFDETGSIKTTLDNF